MSERKITPLWSKKRLQVVADHLKLGQRPTGILRRVLVDGARGIDVAKEFSVTEVWVSRLKKRAVDAELALFGGDAWVTLEVRVTKSVAKEVHQLEKKALQRFKQKEKE